MEESVRSIYWEAPEHHHFEKSSDWYWVLGIIAGSGSVVSIILNNVLFGVVIILAAMTMVVFTQKKPRMLEYEISNRGIRISDTLYPYSTLDCFYFDENNTIDPQLLVRSKKLFVPLLILPIPLEYIDDIEDIIAPRIPEEFMEEPFAHKLMEFFGF